MRKLQLEQMAREAARTAEFSAKRKDSMKRAAKLVLPLPPLFGMDGVDMSRRDSVAEVQAFHAFNARLRLAQQLLLAGLPEEEVLDFMTSPEHPDRMISMWWVGLRDALGGDWFDTIGSARSFMVLLGQPWADLVAAGIQSEWHYAAWIGRLDCWQSDTRRLYRQYLADRVNELRVLVDGGDDVE